MRMFVDISWDGDITDPHRYREVGQALAEALADCEGAVLGYDWWIDRVGVQPTRVLVDNREDD